VTYIRTHPHIHTSTHPHIHTYAHPHKCIYAHPHIHTCAHTYTHTLTYSDALGWQRAETAEAALAHYLAAEQLAGADQYAAASPNPVQAQAQAQSHTGIEMTQAQT
jgi:hypothetical protein